MEGIKIGDRIATLANKIGIVKDFKKGKVLVKVSKCTIWYNNSSLKLIK